MLISNIVTLIITLLWNVATLPRTSRRWKIPSLKRRDVAPNVATLPCLRPNTVHFSVLTLYHPCLNPGLHAHPSTLTLAGVPYHTGRRPVFCPPTPSLTPPSPSHTPSPLSGSAIRHTARRFPSLSLVLHLGSAIPH